MTTTAEALALESRHRQAVELHAAWLSIVRMASPWMPVGPNKWAHWSFGDNPLREGRA